jgi:hypothetical protein
MSKRSSSSFPHAPSAYGSGPQDNKIIRGTVHGYSSLGSTAGGVIDAFITMDPGSISNTDFADFSVTYDEFRVIGCQLSLFSAGPNSTTNNSGIVGFAFDNDTASVPGSLGVVQQYGTYVPVSAVMVHDQGKPLQLRFWRPTAGPKTDVPWVDIANPSGSLGSIRLYSSGLSASTTYLYYAIELYMEFRGRR